MRFTKKPVTIDATQWFKNGDHPDDNVMRPFEDTSKVPTEPREGEVVRYFRRPDVAADCPCRHCSKVMNDHGWIDTLEGGHVVCPGDWVITGVKGERYPCKPDIFADTYSIAPGKVPDLRSEFKSLLDEKNKSDSPPVQLESLGEMMLVGLRKKAVVYKKDGNQICAHRSDFVDLHSSAAGFGDTEAEALFELLVEERFLKDGIKVDDNLGDAMNESIRNDIKKPGIVGQMQEAGEFTAETHRLAAKRQEVINDRQRGVPDKSGFSIEVNGKSHRFYDSYITYEQLLHVAYPGLPDTAVLSAVYNIGEQTGTMYRGSGSLPLLKEGINRFTIVDTSNA